jgi:hypothetical protein
VQAAIKNMNNQPKNHNPIQNRAPSQPEPVILNPNRTITLALRERCILMQIVEKALCSPVNAIESRILESILNKLENGEASHD